MKLSVIIPCLNAESTLATQLEALAAQQWAEPWELIISDNGSTDNSVKVVQKHKEHFPILRVINASDRKGASHARNAGVRMARSDRLAFCDADDEVSPGWVASFGNALVKDDVVYGQFRFDKFNDPHQAELMAQRWKSGLYKGSFLPGGGSGNLGIKRWVHEAIGGFDEHLQHSEDADYYWRLQLEGFKLHYVPKAVVQVRVGRVNRYLPYLYRRGKNRASSNYWSYKRYQHLGMLPPPPFNKSLVTWWRVLIKGARACLQSKRSRAAWLEQFAKQTGDLVGQLQGRITSPIKPYQPGNINRK